MRADARRNQERILAAAKAEIAGHGPDVGMDQIARAANVAVGTLYRHYPTKTDLVEAVMRAFTESLVDWAEQAATSLAATGDAMARIEELLTNFIAAAAGNQGLTAAAAALNAAPASPEQENRGLKALQILVTAAQHDGDLSAAVVPQDIYLLMLAAPGSRPGPERTRWLQIVLAGLRGLAQP